MVSAKNENLLILEGTNERIATLQEQVKFLVGALRNVAEQSQSALLDLPTTTYQHTSTFHGDDKARLQFKQLKEKCETRAKKIRTLKEALHKSQGVATFLQSQNTDAQAEVKNLTLELERVQFELKQCEAKVKNGDHEEVKTNIGKVLKVKEKELNLLEKEFDDYRRRKEAEMKVIQQDLRNSAADARKESEFKEMERERDSYKAVAFTAKEEVDELKRKLKDAEKQFAQRSISIQAMESEMQSLRILNQEHMKAAEVLKAQICQGETERRALHNKVMELKGNIRVYCRLRPVLPSDESREEALAEPLYSSHTDGRGVKLVKPKALDKPTQQEWSFTFDRFFEAKESQSSVFADVSDMIQSALDGYRVCIFAYGQTGSGKTHTMLGTANDPGVIPQAMHQICAHSKRMEEDGWDICLNASFLEIYNDKVRDLLAPRTKSGGSEVKYDIKYDSRSNESTVTNLTSFDVQSKERIDDLIERSMINRATAATKCNDQSSRSHSVFRLRIEGTRKNGEENFKGLLNLVDLAGSERLNKSGVEGTRQKEAVHINKSLTSLGDVIAALANKEKFIPYRNSKLTYFLQDSLGGDCKTLMFVNLSPLHESFNESLCSLRFAQKVNACEIGRASKNARVDLRS